MVVESVDLHPDERVPEGVRHVDHRTERHEIYEWIKRASNEQVANNVMSLLPPVGWADVATKTDLASLETGLSAEIARVETALRAEIGRVESSLRGEIGRLDSKIDRVDSKIDVMASDLRTEMHQSIRTQTWALVAWTTALAGLIVALGR